MLDEIRIQINKNKHCMLRDGASILPLCIIPYYGVNELIDNDEFAHKAPVLLDCFYENYQFEWDLTTKRVSEKIDQDLTIPLRFNAESEATLISPLRI